MELYGFMEREKKIPSYFFIITNFFVNRQAVKYIYPYNYDATIM